MISKTQKIENIIACIDGSPATIAVCDWASWLSTQLNTPLTLLHALEKTSLPDHIDLSGTIGLDSRDLLLEELTQLDEKRGKLALEYSKHLLEDAKQRIQSSSVVDMGINTIQRHGKLVETINDLKTKIDLIVIGRQGQTTGEKKNHAGSQLESVIRLLDCPILVGIAPFVQPKKIMFAYDGSDTGKAILKSPLIRALFQPLECHLVMVGENTVALQEGEMLLNQGEIISKSVCLEGDVQSGLINYAKNEKIDLTVMGAYSHSRLRQLFIGSNTSKMLNNSESSLLLF